MSANPVSLEDKYTLASGRVFLTGTQALVRLAMVQRERDLAAGLNTAGFISGYRGSPLGGFDQALWKARRHLEDHHIHFTPGVNEELTETVNTSGSIFVSADSPKIAIPADFQLPEGGVHIRWPDAPMEQELRLQRDKIYAALAYARANKLDRITIDSPRPRLGIMASGKSYLDVMQALEDLGIDAKVAADIGLRVYKVSMPWPLEPQGVRAFAQGLEEILVVEEKRQLMEYQLKEQLYNWRHDVRPHVVGKYDDRGEWEVD